MNTPDWTEPNEQVLVDRCRRGDRTAQHAIYERTCGRIYRLLRKMTGDPDLAFDLAQDTYVRAFTRLGRFNGQSAISTWLYRIAINLALQSLRRTRGHRQRFTKLERAPSVGKNPHTQDVRLDVEEALQQLSPVDRAMLVLRYQDGLDYRAIAAVVGCAEGTVGSRLNRARQRLRELLGPGYAPREATRAFEHQTDRALSGSQVHAGRPLISRWAKGTKGRQ